MTRDGRLHVWRAQGRATPARASVTRPIRGPAQIDVYANCQGSHIAAGTSSSPSPERPRGRLTALPRTVVPSSYAITLEPDLEAATFSGRRRSRSTWPSRCTRSCSTPSSWRSTRPGSSWPTAAASTPRSPTTRAPSERRSTLSGELPAGPGDLARRVQGHPQRQAARLLPIDLHRRRGREPRDRHHPVRGDRRPPAFPCWDEPDFKAAFAVTLVVDDLLTPSPTPPSIGRPADDGRRRVRFAETMQMSTYLVAFVVGPLEASRRRRRRHAAAGLIRPARAHLAAFALESARSRCGSSPSTTASPTRATSSTCRDARLRVRRHGEPRLRDLPRDGAARRPESAPPSPSSSGSPT